MDNNYAQLFEMVGNGEESIISSFQKFLKNRLKGDLASCVTDASKALDLFSNTKNPQVLRELLSLSKHIRLDFSDIIISMLNNNNDHLTEVYLEFLWQYGCDKIDQILMIATIKGKIDLITKVIPYLVQFNLEKLVGNIEYSCGGKHHSHTPLMAAVKCEDKDCRSLNIFLDAPHNIFKRDNEGYTVLHHAVMSNNIEAVKRILEYGCNISCKSKRDETAVELAVLNNKEEILDVFLGVEGIGDDANSIKDLLYLSLTKDNVNVISKILNKIHDVNILMKDNKSPLEHALKSNQSCTVLELLSKGADPDVVMSCGINAFQYAVLHSSIDIISATMNITNNLCVLFKDGSTIFEKAVKSNNLELVRKLINKGISVNNKMTCGYTPLYYLFKEKNSLQMIGLIINNLFDSTTEMAVISEILTTVVNSNHEHRNDIANSLIKKGAFIDSGNGFTILERVRFLHLDRRYASGNRINKAIKHKNVRYLSYCISCEKRRPSAPTDIKDDASLEINYPNKSNNGLVYSPITEVPVAAKVSSSSRAHVVAAVVTPSDTLF